MNSSTPHARIGIWLSKVCVLCCLIISVSTNTASSQSAGMVVDSLAISCFEDFKGLGSVGVATSESFPSIRSGLYSNWKSAGIEVYELVDEKAVSEDYNRLVRYRVERVGVSYNPAGGKNLKRELDLVLYQTTSDKSRKVISNDKCERRHSDIVLKDLPRDEPPDFNITITESGGKSRFVKPALLAGTVAAISYLFFTVRSGE